MNYYNNFIRSSIISILSFLLFFPPLTIAGDSIHPMFNIRIGYPQIVALGTTVQFGIPEPGIAPIVQASVGEGGGKIGVGMGRAANLMTPELGAWGMAGISARISVLQTWGASNSDLAIKDHRTYIGVEGTFMILIGGDVGIYRRLDGSEGEWIVAWGAGVGF